MADRSIRNVNLAVVDLDSLFFTGRTGVNTAEKPPRLKGKLLTEKKIDNVCSASTRFVGGC